MQVRAVLAAVFAIGLTALHGVASAQTYASFALGRSRAELGCVGNSRCGSSSTALKVAGGVMVVPVVGLEGTYFQQGKARLNGMHPTLGALNAEYRTEGVGLFGVAVAPITDAFSLIGKLGIVSAKVKLTGTSGLPGGAAGTSARHADLAWGVGVGHALGEQLAARLEWERMRVKFVDEKGDLNLVTLALLYRF